MMIRPVKKAFPSKKAIFVDYWFSILTHFYFSDKSEKKDNHDGWSSSTVDYDEEEYFNGSDEEDSLPTAQIPPESEKTKDTKIIKAPLVSYEGEDDEDEEELLVQNKATKETEKVEPTSMTIEEKEEEEEEETNQSLKRKDRSDDEDDNQEEKEAAKASLSPPPFKSRKQSIKDDEEDDVLAKRSAAAASSSSSSLSSSPRQSPLAKKIVIKTSTIEKMRSQ